MAANEDVCDELLLRLQHRLQGATSQLPLDLDFLHFIIQSEISLILSLCDISEFPEDILFELGELADLVSDKIESMESQALQIDITNLSCGAPKMLIPFETIQKLLELQLSIPCISKLLGVSVSTVKRRMKEHGLSVRDSYSTLSDPELDEVIRSILLQHPNSGYRMVKGQLTAMGSRIQWQRIKDSMHRVDAAGILSRLSQRGCVIRRTYSVPGPLSLVHVDTNHKLIRYNMIIFCGIDGFSRKVLYLDVANNNCANTAFKFFYEATKKYGVPSRVRADQGVENVDIAYFMFTVRGTGRASFMTGKSTHNQRVERLWRDVRKDALSVYEMKLQLLEDDGLLDVTNNMHLFCVHYTFIPRLQRSLQTFVSSWNNHPLATEHYHTPEQLWVMGNLRCGGPRNLESDPGLEWEHAMMPGEGLGNCGVQVPQFLPLLTENEREQLQTTIDPLLSSSGSTVRECYLQMVLLFGLI